MVGRREGPHPEGPHPEGPHHEGPQRDGNQPPPTVEQARAIEAQQRTVFVSAGAGSGKTRVLVERYLRAVIDERVPMADVPTVTFTRKAAGEMRGRIRERLLARGEASLAWSLDGAPIGTIHSLCSRLLRANALAAGVDPGFDVLEEDRADILLQEALAEAWERRLTEADDGRLALMAVHGDLARSGASVLYGALRQRGETTPRLHLPVPADPLPALACLRDAVDAVLREAPGFRPGSWAAKNAERLAAGAGLLEGSGLDRDWRSLERLADLRPNMNVGGCRDLFASLLTALKGAVAAFGKVHVSSLGTLVDDLLVDVAEIYEARKRALGVLDFADLELRTLALLEGGVIAPPFGTRSLLLVDEFQDTNSLQCRILDGLGTSAVLTVGDRQQSIYGFRGADVTVFEERQRAVAPGSAGHAAPGPASHVASGSDGDALFAPLSLNFRSTPEVLAAINHLFGSPGLFGNGFAALEAPSERGSETTPGPERRQTSPAPAPGTCPPRATPTEGDSGAAVEIVVVDPSTFTPADDLGGPTDVRHAAEATVVAERVRAVLQNRIAEPGQVAVLLRALTHVERYEQALRDAGVPVYVVGGRGFYERDELSDLLALLRVLVNPYDDFSLAVVLRSPVGRFSDDLLFLAREQARTQGKRFLWEVLSEGRVADAPPVDAERLPTFVSLLDELRSRVGRPGLATLIDDAASAFDYDLVLLAAPDGRRRFANLRKLMRLADEYESVDGPDLRGLVAYLETRKDLDASREGSAPVQAEGDDVVRIMTIHQAKGLEFPIVVVAGLGDRPRSKTERFIVGRDGEVAVRLKGPGRMDDVPLVLGPADRLQAERDEAERMEAVRLFYVAATRAKKRLLLVGTPTGSASEQAGAPLAWMLGAVGLTPADVSGWDVGHTSRHESGLDLAVTVAAPAPAAAAASPPEPVPPVAPAGPSAVVPPGAPSPVPPEALPATGGGVSPLQVSFSSLAAYEHCPRGYYLRHVLRVRPGMTAEDPIEPTLLVDDVLEGREPGGWRLGVAVHAALESLVAVERPTDLELSAAVESGLAAVSEGEVDRNAVERLCRAFWRSPLATSPAWTSARAEEYFVFARGETLITGVMDAVARTGDAWWVVDYKTNRLSGRTPEEAFDTYGLQREIYALAVLEAGATSVDLHFVFLEDPEHPVSRRYTRADVDSLRRSVDEALEGLRQGRFPARDDDCSHCDVALMCRAHA